MSKTISGFSLPESYGGEPPLKDSPTHAEFTPSEGKSSGPGADPAKTNSPERATTGFSLPESYGGSPASKDSPTYAEFTPREEGPSGPGADSPKTNSPERGIGFSLPESYGGSPAPKEGPSAWDKLASSLAGVGNFATGFVAEQVHAAGQDFVSRVFLNESWSPPQHGLEPEKDRASDRDQGMDR